MIHSRCSCFHQMWRRPWMYIHTYRHIYILIFILFCICGNNMVVFWLMPTFVAESCVLNDLYWNTTDIDYKDKKNHCCLHRVGAIHGFSFWIISNVPSLHLCVSCFISCLIGTDSWYTTLKVFCHCSCTFLVLLSWFCNWDNAIYKIR